MPESRPGVIVRSMPVAALASPAELELAESERVLLWRITRLVDAGCDSVSAIELAVSPVDLHLAVDLLDRGCPAELALRILV